MISVQIQDFSVAEIYDTLRKNTPESLGAIALFVGLVRDFTHTPKLASLHIECYPAMVERELRRLVDRVRQQFPGIQQIEIIHRIGELSPQEQIVCVGVSATHRAQAFSACEVLIDQLKTTAPFWKKEIRTDGTEYWLEHNTPARNASLAESALC